MKNDWRDFIEYVNTQGFIDKQMANLYSKQDAQLVNGVWKCSVKYGFAFDEQRIKEWLEFCNKMNNIDKTDLINIAISMKFEELNKKIKDLEYENVELKEQIGVLEEALVDKGE